MRPFARRQPGHQRQHQQAEHQVRGHHHRHQLVGHRPGAERALHAHRDQRADGQGRRAAQLAPVAPGHPDDGDDQHAQEGADVAVDHLDPGLGQSDRPERHAAGGLMDVGHGAQWSHAAVTARPVGATQPGIGQAHKGAEHDEVQRQEPGEEDEFAIALLDAVHGQPMRELYRSLLMSLRTLTPSASGGNCNIRLPSGSMTHMGPNRAADAAASCPSR
ncbi:Uncharacterised protein [Bordetella pertussis]|nr:Uncharacterised protein [Bordetella pertussis]